MGRVEITIHSDESGSFVGRDPRTGEPTRDGEPFVMVAIAHRTAAFTPADADALWRTTGLGEPSAFHAGTGALPKATLDRAARQVLSHLADAPGVHAITRWYRHRAGLPLPRPDVYLDVAFHLVLEAAKTVAREAVEDGDWRRLAPLKVEVNLARRQALNLRPLEAALARHLRVVLRHAGLAALPSADRRRLERGIDERYVSVHCGIVPVEQSVSLALSDLLSNFTWRSLHHSGAERPPGEIAPRELDGWLRRDTWEAITADDPIGPAVRRDADPAASPSPPPDRPTPVESLRAVLAETSAPTPGDLRRAGIWPEGIEPQARGALLRLVLDDAEDACEVLRDLDRADALARLATDLLADDGWTRAIDEQTRDALGMSADSVRLAVVNHRGRHLPGWLDVDRTRDRSRRLAGDGRNLDGVALLHNRIAVNALNRFAFEEAVDTASGLAELLRAERRGVTALFGGAPGPSWSFGALMGTLGQAYALQGFVARDPALQARAESCFGEAIDQFSAPADTNRQWTYAAHLLLDKVRLAGEDEFPVEWLRIFDVIGDELEADRADFCDDPDGPESWRQAYAVHVLLKRAWLFDEVPGWAPELAEGMVAAADGPMAHPRQQIGGLLAMLLDLPADDPLVERLRRTAQVDAGLVGTIARTWLLDVDARAGAPTRLDAWHAALPPWLRPGWESAGMHDALLRAARERTPFAEILPFYYL